jgi:hypothetical protein
MPELLIETERLVIRSVRVSDAESIAMLVTPGVSRWLTNFPLPYTVQLAQRRVERIREASVRGIGHGSGY